MVDLEQVKKYDDFDKVRDEVQALDEQLNHDANYADIAKCNINLAFAINMYGGISNVRDLMADPEKNKKMKQQIGVEAARFMKETKRPELEQIVSKE